MSLQQDCSKGWLVVRYAAATKQLEVRHGFVGAVFLPSFNHLHAIAIRQATECVVNELACPSSKYPFTAIERDEYTKSIPRLVPKIEAISADGAADEQLALQMMFGGQMFHSLKIVTRDLPHCMRRVASRTSFADPFLKLVPLDPSMVLATAAQTQSQATCPRLELFIKSRNAPCQLIQHSDLFKACSSGVRPQPLNLKTPRAQTLGPVRRT